jgi:hypothetical protein
MRRGFLFREFRVFRVFRGSFLWLNQRVSANYTK